MVSSEPGLHLMVGPRVPRQGGPLAAALGRLVLRLMGWRFAGDIPDVPRAVLIVAPHTSNWDFLVGLMAKLALRLKVDWLAKHTIFRFPLGLLWRRLGGIPINRRAPQGVVTQVLDECRRRESILLGLTPEGTRARVERWKSGFHRIALAAELPIVPVAFDFSRRLVIFYPLFQPSADYEADLAQLQALYRPEMACRRENY